MNATTIRHGKCTFGEVALNYFTEDSGDAWFCAADICRCMYPVPFNEFLFFVNQANSKKIDMIGKKSEQVRKTYVSITETLHLAYHVNSETARKFEQWFIGEVLGSLHQNVPSKSEGKEPTVLQEKTKAGISKDIVTGDFANSPKPVFKFKDLPIFQQLKIAAKSSGTKQADLARNLKKSPGYLSCVAHGHIKNDKIEKEITAFIAKHGPNPESEVVLE